MSNWRIGQKVVCVDARVSNTIALPNRPSPGGVYTIRAIEPPSALYPEVAFLLVELVNPRTMTDEGYAERSFMARRFRPLDPLEEQIERIESEGCPEPELQEA